MDNFIKYYIEVQDFSWLWDRYVLLLVLWTYIGFKEGLRWEHRREESTFWPTFQTAVLIVITFILLSGGSNA